MKAVRLYKPNADTPGAAAVIETVPVPEPGQGQVLVQLRLRPVDPADVFTLMGVYPGAPPTKTWPITPGLDGMGVVTKLGDGATEFKEGQRVAIAGLPLEDGNGSWAEYAVYKESDLVAVPDSVSDEAASQFWVNPVTVYGMLHSLQVPQGGTVVFAAAGSALCRMGIHLAKHMGLKSIGTVRREEQRQEILDHGADYCFSETGEALSAKIKEATGGQGADGALDSVGGEMTGALVGGLKQGKKVLIYGMMSGMAATIPIVPLLFGDVSVHGFWLTHYTKRMTPQQKRETVHTVMDLIEQGIIKPGHFVGKRYPLEQVEEAVEVSNSVGRGEKVFISTCPAEPAPRA